MYITSRWVEARRGEARRRGGRLSGILCFGTSFRCSGIICVYMYIEMYGERELCVVGYSLRSLFVLHCTEKGGSEGHVVRK